MSDIFKGKKQVNKQKLRGGYYTPAPLCDYLVNWAIRTGDENILEPSCGNGNFITSALGKLNSLGALCDSTFVAVEISEEEMQVACEQATKVNHNNLSIHWYNDDFFRVYKELKRYDFNVIIGNPPFIRFQYFDDESREIAFNHLRDAYYRPTKLANAWAAFIQLSIELLRDDGRLAMVVPAELLQVKYANELRERIVQHFQHVIIVSFKKLVFPDIQQEVLLLLAEGKRTNTKLSCDVHTIEIKNENELSAAMLQKAIAHSKAKHTRKGMKWTSFFLDDEAFTILDKAQKNKELTRLGKLVDVDVGIVTGRNTFFVLDNNTIKKLTLKRFTVPVVGKTAAIGSLIFNDDKFRQYRREYPAFLLNLKDIDYSKFPSSLKKYISLGESEGVNKGYKCRIRKRWFDVPSVYVSDGFLFRQIHKYPLLVVNDAHATCTDTIHRVKLKAKVDLTQLSAAFINSLTFAWSEVCGRSYGGGVLELEPTEAERLPVPYFDNIELDVDFINNNLENGNVEKCLDYVDKTILYDKLGLSIKELKALRRAWETLRDRRINRK